MSKQMVSDLQPNASVSTWFAVMEKSLQPFKNKSGQFLNVTLGDRSGTIMGRAWDNAEQLAELCVVNTVIKVEGRVDEYRGKLQLIIEDLAPCGEDEYDKADLLRCSEKDTTELVQQLQGYVEQVQQPHLRQLLELFFGDEAFLLAFAQAPGAKRQHHAHLGGLLEHTLGVVRILCTLHEIHPQLDRDLLITGALLHDAGKLEEYSTGVAIDYTDIGRLVGHIVITDRWVRERIMQIPDFPQELDNKLNHLLLSHHGQKEYGAPVLPMTAEATALHYADNLDAHVQCFIQAIEEGGVTGNKWTEYQRMFDRYFYIGSQPAQGADETGGSDS
ncbi:MAG: HD domain-containing protein [Armatimonadia bacterium]